MENNTPLSRVEDILQSTIDNTEYDKPPQSRVESLLIELKEVIEGGGGGGGSAYHPAGSVDYVSELPSPSADYLGYVYDIIQAFTTTSDFKEGAGKRYPAGSNIAIVDVGTPESPSYKYDVLSGFIDTSNFVEKEEGKGLSTNDYTNADKTKLASLENYDDTEIRAEIDEKADDADLAAVAKSGSYNDLADTPDIPSKTSDLTNDSHFVNATQMDEAIDSTDISSSITGINPSITDAADSPIVGLVIEGRTTKTGDAITNVGDNGLSVTACGKNLAYYPQFEPRTTNGITFTWVNSSCIHIQGTATNYASMFAQAIAQFRLKPGTYTLTNNLPAASTNGYMVISKKDTGGWETVYSYIREGFIATFTLQNYADIWLQIVIIPGQTINQDVTVMLELGSTATAYEPYKGSTAVISTGLPLCSVGDVKDAADFTAGVVHKKSGIVVLNGSEANWWLPDQTTVNNSKCILAPYLPILPATNKSEYTTDGGICDKLTYNSLVNIGRDEYGICITGTRVDIRINGITTVEDLKTYLASNPVTIIYELAEPYDAPMTASEVAAYHDLRTFENTTNITCTDSPQMILDYMLNTENGASVGQVAANFVGVMYSLMPYPNAGAHNAIYRGKYLGSAVTSVQWAAIKAGTFDDMYIGDYWVIGGRVWRIAAFDYYFNTGDTACTSHHVVIVPDAGLYTYKMNNAGTTAGGYVGSKMYTEGLVQALSIVETAFGAAHILERREFLTNAVTNGVPSGASIYSIKIWLMTEMNVYGCKIFSTVSNGNSRPANYVVDKTQYPLFMYDPQIIGANRVECWLRDIVTSETFACISDYGYAGYSSAANDLAVRPAFAIYQS